VAPLMRTAIITVSSSVSRREREDKSGPLLAKLAEQGGCEIEAIEVVPDDYALIETRMRHYVDEAFALILTTGGTGLTPDDVTPEATSAVIERTVPGIPEALRAESLKHTPHGMISREVAGVAGNTLVVNFPGNPKAIEELFGVIAPVLAHAVRTISGDSSH
jgi:molybdopterin adenylyltransferase